MKKGKKEKTNQWSERQFKTYKIVSYEYCYW